MNSYEKTINAHTTLTGEDEESLSKRVHEMCDASTEYTLKGRSVLGKVVRVIDGDSCKVSLVIDDKASIFSIRLSGIDCPETRTRNLIEKRMGYDAKSRVETLTLGKIVVLKLGKFDKFGRLLGEITNSDGVNVGDDLMSLGLAVPYDGGKRPVWSGSKV